ncbi:MAG: hypothetical protein ACRD16_00300 [Thermoanaerobaculia bacterium]
MGGLALRVLAATARKGAAARPCERFPPGAVSVERMEPLYREAARIGSILAADATSDSLLTSKASFHSEIATARTRRRSRDDFAFVTRLRWAEQWIEIGLLSAGVGGESARSFRRALDMIEEANRVFTGEASPGCEPPETELPPVVRES